MMAETQGLFERMRSVGGKCYLPHSSIRLSPAEWEDHFGPDAWKRLAGAKNRFDPNHVLTPGPGIFMPPAGG
jgi:FAD/FMN-containing dehydrogenase